MAIKYKDKEIEAIVFDFDGTFYLNEGLEEKIWSDSRKKMVQKLIESSSIADIKKHNQEILLGMFIDRAYKFGWENSFIEFGGNIDDFHQIADNVSKAEHLKHDKDLTNFIKEMQQYVPIRIFTGSTRKTVIDALKVLVDDLWLPLSENLLATDDMRVANKPNKEAYEEMLGVFGIEPSKTIFVDDQEVEVNTAANLDIITFLIQGSGVINKNGNSHVVLNSLVELRNHLNFR